MIAVSSPFRNWGGGIPHPQRNKVNYQNLEGWEEGFRTGKHKDFGFDSPVPCKQLGMELRCRLDQGQKDPWGSLASQAIKAAGRPCLKSKGGKELLHCSVISIVWPGNLSWIPGACVVEGETSH